MIITVVFKKLMRVKIETTIMMMMLVLIVNGDIISYGATREEEEDTVSISSRFLITSHHAITIPSPLPPPSSYHRNW